MRGVTVAGWLVLLLWLVALLSTDLAHGQTPVSDDTTHTKLDSVISNGDTTNTRLGNLETGLVTVQQYQATQTALLDQVQKDLSVMRGVDPTSTTVTDWRINEARESDISDARLGLVTVSVLACILAMAVAGVVRSWL